VCAATGEEDETDRQTDSAVHTPETNTPTHTVGVVPKSWHHFNKSWCRHVLSSMETTLPLAFCRSNLIQSSIDSRRSSSSSICACVAASKKRRIVHVDFQTDVGFGRASKSVWSLPTGLKRYFIRQTQLLLPQSCNPKVNQGAQGWRPYPKAKIFSPKPTLCGQSSCLSRKPLCDSRTPRETHSKLLFYQLHDVRSRR
jgi:hypothetical protein